MQKNNSNQTKRNFVSNFAHLANQKFRKGLKSSSFVQQQSNTEDISDHATTSTQTNFKSQTSIALNRMKTPVCRPHVDIYRESCTQTSKTVLVVTDNEDDEEITPRLCMSPDSLSPISNRSPIPKEKGDYSLSNSSGVSVEDFMAEFDPSMKLMTGNALTKKYLAKHANKTTSTPRLDWITKPFNDVHVKTSAIPAKQTVRSPRTRFKHTTTTYNIQHNIANDKKPADIVEEVIEVQRKPPKKNQSFMSPTIASEIKDQRILIDSISKLISPTRRGRSISPKPQNSNKQQQIDGAVGPHKVPYIDKSAATILTMDDKSQSTIEGMSLNLKGSCEETCDTSRMETCSSFNSTDCALNQSLMKMKDEDWNIALVGLAEIIEACKVIEIDSIYPHMTIINQRLIELIKCPRSHVVRTACQAVGHIFEYIKDTRRPEFDELVDTLLFKTADSNKYIRHDANLALDCMVTHITTFHAIRALCSKGPEHKNPLVRTATARLLVCAIVIAGPQNILNPHNNEYTRKRIIVNMVRFLDDKCQEVRKFGERIYKLLCKDRIFELYLRKYLEPEIVTKMRRCIVNNNGQRL